MIPAFFLGLILLLLPAYLWRFSVLGLPTTFLEILIVVFLISAVIAIYQNRDEARRQFRRLETLNWAIGLFLAAAIIATAISPEPLRALGQLKAFVLEPIMVFYAAVLTIKKSDLKFLLACLFISASAISLFGIIQYATHLGLPLRFWGSGEEPKRIVSIFEYPNALALYLAPLLGFFAVLWQKRWLVLSPAVIYSGLVLMSVALLLTFSRGAWLAVVLGIAFPFLIDPKARKTTILVLIVMVVLAFLPPIKQRLTLADASTAAHKDLFGAAIVQIAEDPFLGNGLYGFRTALEKQNFEGEILNYPHNVFFNFWLELGFLGLLSFALILFLTLSSYKKIPTALKLAAAVYLLVMLLHGLVDVPYFKNDLSVLFWFVLSLFYLEDSELHSA